MRDHVRRSKCYYEKLRRLGAYYHTPVVDFADHDADLTFCHDTMGHLAPSGLVHYNEVLDGFFHGVIPPQSKLTNPAHVSKRLEEYGARTNLPWEKGKP